MPPKRKIEPDFHIRIGDPQIVQECLRMQFPPFEQMVQNMNPTISHKIYDKIKVLTKHNFYL